MDQWDPCSAVVLEIRNVWRSDGGPGGFGGSGGFGGPMMGPGGFGDPFGGPILGSGRFWRIQEVLEDRRWVRVVLVIPGFGGPMGGGLMGDYYNEGPVEEFILILLFMIIMFLQDFDDYEEALAEQ